MCSIINKSKKTASNFLKESSGATEQISWSKLKKSKKIKVEKWRFFFFFPNIIILQKNPINGKNIFFENLRKFTEMTCAKK